MSLPCKLYYFNILGTNLYKVGITTKTIEQRYRTAFDRDQIVMVHIEEFATGKEAYTREQAIHKEFEMSKYTGGKVLSNGNTEIFVGDILGLNNKAVV